MGVPTSPNMPVTEGIIKTQKEFSDVLTQDLSDEEIQSAFTVMIPIIQKWQEKFRAKFSLYSGPEAALEDVERFEDELKTELREKLGIIISVDVTPIFHGESIVVEFNGLLPTHTTMKHGFDHERKAHNVKQATDRGEDWLGQKGKKHERKRPSGPARKEAGS